ncbi:sensor histidine kinase [Methanobacterium oryzae]|uniref:sensor histidine kinase n=1 Tax=Methanobacterium oryzae TaxID=69540 RepID=UPI003D19C9E7
MEDKLIRVLIIEDNLEDFRIIEEMLKEVQNPAFELYHSKRLDEGIKSLIRDGFDILLLDLGLPDSTGLDTFASVYEQAPEIPIVILSGFGDEDIAIRAVREGAQDYLVKGQVNSLLLSRSISYAIERKLIEDELIRHRYYLNELVEKRTEDLEEANRSLQEEIHEKEILIEEIYKRIQYTLKLISSIINMETSVVKNEDLSEIYIRNQTRANAIALLNDLLDQSEDFAMIDFGKYTVHLLDYLFEVYDIDKKDIKLDIDMHGILMDINTAIPYGLILNELIFDKLKQDYSNNEKEIFIGLEHTHNDIKLVLKYKDGVDIKSMKEHDMSFIEAILEQFNGSIEFKDDGEMNVLLREIKI